jgi:hypothetical protein
LLIPSRSLSDGILSSGALITRLWLQHQLTELRRKQGSAESAELQAQLRQERESTVSQLIRSDPMRRVYYDSLLQG